MLKLIVPFLLLVLVGAAVWYFSLRGDDMGDDFNDVQDPPPKSRVTPSPTGAMDEMDDNEVQEEPEEVQPDEEPVSDSPPMGDLDPEVYDDEPEREFEGEMEEEDYSEPVDKEDFVDFVNAALDELETDEAMATAIVREMGKILDAQPQLQDEGARFFRACLNKSVSANVKSRCQAELNRIKR